MNFSNLKRGEQVNRCWSDRRHSLRCSILPVTPTGELRNADYGVCAPLIHPRMVAYSGESLVNRTPPPCGRIFEPETPSVSELEVGFLRIRLFSGFAVSTTFFTVAQVASNNV